LARREGAPHRSKLVKMTSPVWEEESGELATTLVCGRWPPVQELRSGLKAVVQTWTDGTQSSCSMCSTYVDKNIHANSET
jgi:hypothetical protein